MYFFTYEQPKDNVVRIPNKIDRYTIIEAVTASNANAKARSLGLTLHEHRTKGAVELNDLFDGDEQPLVHMVSLEYFSEYLYPEHSSNIEYRREYMRREDKIIIHYADGRINIYKRTD
jgi:hypothetical protein